jgi:hypothetical protein
MGLVPPLSQGIESFEASFVKIFTTAHGIVGEQTFVCYKDSKIDNIFK